MATTSRFTQAFWDKLISKAKAEREAREMEQGFCDAKLPPLMAGQIIGWRNGESVLCEWEIRYREGSTGLTAPVIGITKGGVTGYEAWYVDHLIDCGLFDDPEDTPICANAGGGGWSRLDIDGAGFRAIVRLFLSRREDYEVTAP